MLKSINIIYFMKHTPNKTTMLYAQYVLLWCYFNYGSSIWNSTGVLNLKVKSNLNHYGHYYYEIDKKSEIYVNIKFHKSLLELTDTLIHEYTHHMQPMEYKYKYYLDNGYNLENHPFEVEARRVARRDASACKKWVLNRIKHENLT